jgi:hypothetical protein
MRLAGLQPSAFVQAGLAFGSGASGVVLGTGPMGAVTDADLLMPAVGAAASIPGGEACTR